MRAGAVAVVTVGLVMMISLFNITTADGYSTVVKMMDANEGTHFVKAAGVCCLVLGFLMTVVGGLGYTASLRESEGAICFYISASAVVAVALMVVAANFFVLEGTVSPVVLKQAEEFCAAATHDMYAAMLECNGTESSNIGGSDASQSCGQDCQAGRERLINMGGCHTLAHLCHKSSYTSIGNGVCVGKDPQVELPKFISPEKVDLSCCQQACDSVVWCSGFVYGSEAPTCRLISTRPPVEHWKRDAFSADGSLRSSNNNTCSMKDWDSGLPFAVQTYALEMQTEIANASDADGVVCYRRDKEPLLIEEAVMLGLWLSAYSMAAATVLFGAGVCGCCVQYSYTTRKRGSKGAAALVFKMVCPCLADLTQADRRMSLVGSEDEGSTSEEDLVLPKGKGRR